MPVPTCLTSGAVPAILGAWCVRHVVSWKFRFAIAGSCTRFFTRFFRALVPFRNSRFRVSVPFYPIFTPSFRFSIHASSPFASSAHCGSPRHRLWLFFPGLAHARFRDVQRNLFAVLGILHSVDHHGACHFRHRPARLAFRKTAGADGRAGVRIDAALGVLHLLLLREHVPVPAGIREHSR